MNYREAFRNNEHYRDVQDSFCKFEDYVSLATLENTKLNRHFLKSKGRLNAKVLRKLARRSNQLRSRKIGKKGKVQVVIPLYGESPSIQECLDSVAASNAIEPEVIIVSNDAPQSVVENCRKHHIVKEIILNTQNLGFGAACDQGISKATSKQLILLNSDACVGKNTLSILVDTLSKDSTTAVVSSVVLNSDGSLVEVGRFFSSDGHTLGFGENCSTNESKFRHIRQVPYASFVCIAIDKEMYKQTGGFDLAYSPAYYEDSDLCLRFLDRGYRVVVDPDAQVTHVGGQSSSELEDLDVIKENNRKYFVDKHREFLESIPKNLEPQKYSHEAEMAMNKFAKRNVLVIADRRNSRLIDRVKEMKDVRVSLIVDSANPSTVSELRRASVEVFLGFEKPMHYWFRDRIGLYDEIIFESEQTFDDLSAMIFLTQPKALIHFEPKAHHED